MRQTILQFFSFFFGDERQVYLRVTWSIISNSTTHVHVYLSWLGGNTRELISFTGSLCNGFTPGCQSASWVSGVNHLPPHVPKMYGSPLLLPLLLLIERKC